MSFFLPGCKEEDGSGYLFKYSLSNDPQNLDPQLATDESALAILGNMYSGLMEYDSNGGIKTSIAESYDISADGLIYTFKLRHDNYWVSDNSDYKVNVTAKDFMFTFKRIFDRNTSSPYADKFLSIKNSSKVLLGEMDTNQLGIKVPDEYTLIFELEKKDSEFLSKLALTAAYPCNEEFFYTTKGKYGLQVDKVIANGPFYLKQWEYDPYGQNNYLILRKNKYYSQNEKIYPSSLNYFVQRDNSMIPINYYNGSTDCLLTDGSDKKAFGSKYITKEYQTSTIGLAFNLNSNVFEIESFRKALSVSVDRTLYADNLSRGYKEAYAIVPSGVTLLNKKYRELVSEMNKTEYDVGKAKLFWQDGLYQLDKSNVDGINILVPDTFVDSDILKIITQNWQNKLSFFCGIKVVTENEYKKAINSGDFDIAIYEIKCSENSPLGVLGNFRTGNSENIYSYSNEEFDKLVSEILGVDNISDNVANFSNAESMVLDNYPFIPLFYKSEYLVYSKDIQDIEYNPFSRQLIFKNAKNFD